MAMEPDSSYEENMFNAPYEVQLMNLGRILENPKLISLFSSNDFLDTNMRNLIEVLKSDKPKEAKNLHLKMFMKSRGLKDWGTESSECKRELFDTQIRQYSIHFLALQANLVLDRLMTTGGIGDNTGVLEALENVKGFIEDATI
jgi:hypothetical protein